jgi:hypothetical protein
MGIKSKSGTFLIFNSEEDMKRKILFGSFLLVMVALISIGITPSATGKDQLVTVLNPAISTKMAERIPLGPRLNTLEGKTIYLYDTQWGGPEAAYSVYEEMQGWFARNMPSVKTVIHRGPSWMADDPGFLKVVTDKKVDAVIIGIAG